MTTRLQDWTEEQERAFQEFLDWHRQNGNAIPRLLINPFRKGFRDREYTPDQIRNHRGLLPVKS